MGEQLSLKAAMSLAEILATCRKNVSNTGPSNATCVSMPWRHGVPGHLSFEKWCKRHYDDVIMSAMASQINSLTIVYSSIYSGADQTKHQSSASLTFVRGIRRWLVNSPHKWPVTRKMFPFDDVIMQICIYGSIQHDKLCVSVWHITPCYITLYSFKVTAIPFTFPFQYMFSLQCGRIWYPVYRVLWRISTNVTFESLLTSRFLHVSHVRRRD